MAINLTVKNTFLDIEVPPLKTAAARRSTSVPRAWKPGAFIDDNHCGSDGSTSVSSDKAEHSLVSFSDSDYQDVQDTHSDCTDECHSCHSSTRWANISDECLSETPKVDTSLMNGAGAKTKVTLSLTDMVEEDAGYTADRKTPLRSKLKSQAKPFVSMRQPPEELRAVLASTVAAVASSPDVVDVKVHDRGMGGTTTIVVESASDNPDPLWAFALAKDALLNAAAQSENTYILGYGQQPFNSLDALSFSAKIACVPAAHQATACWDTYEMGSCPRCATCRWDHPGEVDMMQVIVMMKKGYVSCIVGA